jgi:hypothetical protein
MMIHVIKKHLQNSENFEKFPGDFWGKYEILELYGSIHLLFHGFPVRQDSGNA